jgi:hypothetical protein
LQPSDNDFGFAYLIAAIEQSIRRAERAFVDRDWAAFNEELAAQRRGFHAVQNALTDAERASYPTDPARKRIRLLIRVREEQLGRLCTYRDECARRLDLFAKSAPMRRAALAEAKKASARLGYLDVTR